MKDPRSDDTMKKSHWAIPEKKPNRGLRIYFFGKPEIFHFFTLFLRQNKAQPPGYSTKLY